MKEGKILELLQEDDYYNEICSKYEILTYLSNLSDSQVYLSYLPAIEGENTHPFTDFSQD